MARLTLLALRVVLVVLLVGSVAVQTAMLAFLAVDLDESDPEISLAQRIAFAVVSVLGIATVQVVLVCVWRLATLVRRGTVFSHASFRYVDIIIGAIVAAAGLMFAEAVVLAPGEAVPPGMVALICGAVVAILGIALVVLIIRMLLAQAVARDVEATQMQAELDEVI